MKKILFILLTLAIPVLLWASEPVREWRSKNGKTIEASFDVDKDSDPEMVYLLKDGKRYQIPLKNLSQADQDYVTRVRKGTLRQKNGELDEIPDEIEKTMGTVVPFENRYALLIGVNNYIKPIPSLKYCVKDMELLAERFQEIGIPKENIILITDGSPTDRLPTRSVICRQIENLTRIMGSKDQLIIAFSGHGVMVDGKSYLCPCDTNLDDENSIVSRDWVFKQLENCKAKQKLFIIDACRNELSLGDKTLGNARMMDDPIGEDTHGFVLMASCDKTQRSWEHPDIEHGVFTYFLAEGLSGAAANEDGYVTIMSLFQYTSFKTRKFVFKEYEKAQLPTIRLGGEMTDFCLAKQKNIDDSSWSLFEKPQSSINTPEPEPPVDIPEPEPSRKAGERFVKKINGVEFAFRWCPLGSFLMGVESEINNYDNRHRVMLSEGFWMMETEVTQEQWKIVMGNNPSRFKGDKLPVENVSWNDCLTFCRKCAQLGLPIQLPTEAQWEYACRAGTDDEYAGELDEMAWYDDNSGDETHSVGTKKPNAWGLYDMHGNVCEWCQDWKGSFSTKIITDPKGPSKGVVRICRGGSWYDLAGGCQSACRSGYAPVFRDNGVGFRCVSSVDFEPSKMAHKKSAGDRLVKVIKGVEFAFRWCPPGTFIMGSSKSEEGRNSDENQFKVTLTKGFWMLETEVTQEQWKAIMDEDKNGYFDKDDTCPGEGFSWNDCQDFCKKCELFFELPLQLPTEAQWEYACRAGSADVYDGVLDEIAWYNTSHKHPVGTKKANAWGLCDMHGNVLEWCNDWYSEYDSGYVIDPIGPSFGSKRVIRGSSYNDDAGQCRAALRRKAEPDSLTLKVSDKNYHSLGFRCIINPDRVFTDIEKTESNTVQQASNDQSSEDNSAALQTQNYRNAGKRSVIIIKGVEFVFRWCPPGSFMMGSPSNEAGRSSDEKKHEVMLSKGFWMMETEVTQKQWEVVMGKNPSKFKGDKLPVECVTWNDCQEFCKQCTQLGLPVQLPSEAQWEYACRAGTSDAFAGNLDGMSWYNHNSKGKTHPVGTKMPNAWGLYDMHGNVWEWCRDWYSDYSLGIITDPTGSSNGFVRVRRGGSWSNDALLCRSARRPDRRLGIRLSSQGFRCVKVQ